MFRIDNFQNYKDKNQDEGSCYKDLYHNTPTII